MTVSRLAISFLFLCVLFASDPRQGAIAHEPESEANVEITTDSDYRYIRANGIPGHVTGQFPNRNNPNTISEQNYKFRVTLHPTVAGKPTGLGMNPFGVAINGVPFDPGAAEFWNDDRSSGWQYEALSGKINLGMDRNNAHVQPGGAYHYHGVPTGLVGDDEAGRHSMHVGYAADGFPIYVRYGYSDTSGGQTSVRRMRSSHRIKSGKRSGGPGGNYDGTFIQDYEYVKNHGDLDECNGRFGATPEYPAGIYHYFLTDEYPFIPRCLRGTPDDSFIRKHGPGGPGGQMRGGRRGPPPRHPGDRSGRGDRPPEGERPGGPPD